jgi:two-component system sensor histidine kinase YesM
MEALSNRDIQVSNMIEIVAQLFRNSIKGDMFVQIRDELDYSKHYLELYNMRYADRLSVEFGIDPDILGFGILKHLLQPILENAIVHGIKPDRDDNRVTVRGYLQKETVILEISDNGRGMEPEQLDRLTKRLQLSHANANTDNIGVLNVNQRIRLAFGEAYGLEIESVKDKGSTVTFVIPAIKKEELIADAQSFNRGR